MKRFKQISKVLIAVSLITVSAFALLKTGVLGKENNTLIVDPNARYDIVVDLDGGKFEVSAKPEFVKMDNGNWLHKYKPSAKPVTVPTPVKEGYEFTGWTVGDNQTLQLEYSIPVWNKKNINLKAHWKSEVSMLLPGKEFNAKLSSMSGFSNVREIRFEKGVPEANGVNVAESGEAIAHIDGDILTIKCTKEIYANPDCSNMFKGFGYRPNTVLNTIMFNNFNTSKVINMNSMFYDCRVLTKLDVSSFNTSNVTNMGGMFYQCEKLPVLNITNFDTSNVKSMQNMFYLCRELISLDVSSFNTSNVLYMDNMFEECFFIMSLDLSNFDTSNVIRMDSMFNSCGSLTTLDISSFNTTNVEGMSYMFSNCMSLRELDLSHFDTPNLNDMRGMFSRCESLVSLNISSFDTTKVRVMETMFEGCTNLSQLDLSNFKISEIWDLNSLFQGCKSLTYLDLSGFNVENTRNFTHMFANCKSLKEIDVSAFDTRNATDFNGMFNGCASITSLDVRGFDTSNVTDMQYLFRGCKNLVDLDLNNFKTSKVTTMDSMFEGCSSLIDLKIDKFDTANVIDMRDMFLGCSKLVSTITIANPDLYNYFNMFTGCCTEPGSELVVNYKDDATKELAKKLVSSAPPKSHVYLFKIETLIRGSEFNNKIKSMPEFNNVNEIRFIKNSKIHTGVDVSEYGGVYAYIDGNILTISSKRVIYANQYCSTMFDDFDKITKYTFDNFNTSCVTSMNGMFSGNTSLVNLDLSSFDTSNVTEMSFMFRDCGALRELDLSNLDISKLKSTNYMFERCKNLSGEILIMNPNMRSSGYSDTFYGCSTSPNAKFVVNYRPNCYSVANNMVDTKSGDSNVFLGESVSNSTVSLFKNNKHVNKNQIKTSKGLNDTLNEESDSQKSINTGEEQHNLIINKLSPKTFVNITLINGPSAQFSKQVIQRPAGKIGDLAKPDLNPKYAGQFGGYFYDKNCTIPVKPNDVVTQDIELYAKW